MTRLTSAEAGYFLTDLFPLLVGILLVLVLNHHQTSHHLFLQTTNTSLDATLSSRIQSRTDWGENCWISSFVLDTFIVVVGVVMLVMLVCWHNRSVYGDRDLLPGRTQSKAATSQVAEISILVKAMIEICDNTYLDIKDKHWLVIIFTKTEGNYDREAKPFPLEWLRCAW